MPDCLLCNFVFNSLTAKDLFDVFFFTKAQTAKEVFQAQISKLKYACCIADNAKITGK